MKATGVVRKMDQLGRIVFPVELRRGMGIKTGDCLEIFVDGEAIVIKKYNPGCLFCGEAKDVVEHKGKKVCKKCIKDIGEK